MRRNARQRWSMSRWTQKVRNLGTMTERPEADLPPNPGGWHFQVSKLLVILLVAAVMATGAFAITLLIALTSNNGRGAPGPNGMPPPPPDLQPIELVSAVTGLFVLAWLAVLVVFARDQILARLDRQRSAPGPGGGMTRDELTGLLGQLRSELAADREGEFAALSDRLTELTGEYGERRETDGYLSGMRMATADDPSPANVRSLRRSPPQR
jgi:hypothetical protein